MADMNTKIVLGLDVPKTVAQINTDIRKLQKQLQKVETTGTLDTGPTVKQINAQIASLHSQLKTNPLLSQIRQAVSELKEIDTLLNEIGRSNTGLSSSDLARIGNDSFDTAGRYGRKAADYLSEVRDASRAGFENASGIAELSLAAQEAGDMTAGLASQYIAAADKAYSLGGSVEKLTEILDGSHHIANQNAVTMSDLAEGMSAVGSQAASLGVAADETTAALATMIATTQQDGTDTAKAFHTILLYLRQVADEEEGITAEGLAKYEDACSALNVSLKETRNGVTSLRDPMEVLGDLADEYAKLDFSDSRRTDLLDAVGNAQSADALNAILGNYDMYEKMLQEYADGTGSLAAEAEKMADTWEGSLNRLSNTWTDTVGNIVDSDAVVAAVNGLNSLLSVVNHVTDSLGPLGTAGLGAGMLAGVQNTGKRRMSVRIS